MQTQDNHQQTERFRRMCGAYNVYRDGLITGDELADAVVDYTDAVKLAAADTAGQEQPWQAGSDLAALFTAATDDEAAAIEAAAVEAGLLLKCQEEDCGAGVGCPGDTCQACGELFSECAICVPGQCPGPDCPGNYGAQS